MRLAIILPWVGEVPNHLSFTCHSMAGGMKMATLLLLHEAAERSSIPPVCRKRGNVKIEELNDGGIAELHTQRILESSPEIQRSGAEKKMKRLFELAPSSLSEFKPTWGWVFGEYLHKYSHWTYTDADVIFGRFECNPGLIFQMHTGLTTGSAE